MLSLQSRGRFAQVLGRVDGDTAGSVQAEDGQGVRQVAVPLPGQRRRPVRDPAHPAVPRVAPAHRRRHHPHHDVQIQQTGVVINRPRGNLRPFSSFNLAS